MTAPLVGWNGDRIIWIGIIVKRQINSFSRPHPESLAEKEVSDFSPL
jgi:hypothetical protein